MRKRRYSTEQAVFSKGTTSVIFIIALSFLSNFVNAEDLSSYLEDYRKTGKADFQKEQSLISSYSFDALVGELMPYFNDSISNIRSKAYYFLFKKGKAATNVDKKKAVNLLLGGCTDNKYGALIGQNLNFLTQFKATDFNEEAEDQIKSLITKERMPHYKSILLLAGYTGSGQGIMQQILLRADLENEKRWQLSLALARQGHESAASFCVEKAKELPVNSNLVYYILPDLIYTRQKAALGYCISLLYSNSKDCSSADPDNPEPVLCGYYIMEKLAPAIIGFPYKVDATGTLDTTDYKKALNTVRQFFETNDDYGINFEGF